MFMLDYNNIVHLVAEKLSVSVSEGDRIKIVRKLETVNEIVSYINNSGDARLRSTQLSTYIILNELSLMGYRTRL